jgi:hypothetical protein
MLTEKKYKRICKVWTTKAVNQWKIKVFYGEGYDNKQSGTGDFVHKEITHTHTHTGKKVIPFGACQYCSSFQ